MTIVPSSLKLTYFDIAGLAEAIRLACFVGGLEFEDERLNFEQFAKLKETFPFKQVPILTINENIVVAQSNAILRYVGNLASLYPKDDILEAAFVDQILAHLYDFGTYVRPTYGIQDEKERIAARQELTEKHLKPMFEMLEKSILASRSDNNNYEDLPSFAVGDSLTIADLYLYAHVQWYKSGFYDGIPTDLADGFPAIGKIVSNVANNEKVIEWNTRRHQPKN